MFIIKEGWGYWDVTRLSTGVFHRATKDIPVDIIAYLSPTESKVRIHGTGEICRVSKRSLAEVPEK